MTDAEKIVSTFRRLGVDCSVSRVVEGPQIRRYELQPGPDTRMMDFRRLSRADDLAAALEAESVMISAPIPGTGRVGVEVARKDRRTVDFDSLPAALKPLTVFLGEDIDGRPTLMSIDESPHALICGQTGGGKSVCLHTIICGLVRALTPADVRLCLVDPKKVELASYESLPHMLFPVADDSSAAIQQLQALVLNMEGRYSLFRALGARDITEANARLSEPLPRFVIVVDELADLMLASKKEVEPLLVKIAQKGRASGLHLILATQYPKAECVTGLLRTNLPTRIAFSVTDQIASRIALGQPGAEKLLGRGDGLYSFAGLPPTRIQGAYCSPERVSDVVNQWTKEVACQT